MDLYKIGRKILFQLDPETAHNLVLKWIIRFFPKRSFYAPRKVMGITFPNPVGLAAGMDKDGRYANDLKRLGFGFTEIGTITPYPQEGNPRPRIFRIPEYNAIINRMGFNNAGTGNFVIRMKSQKLEGITGISIGRNSYIPTKRAVFDYTHCMRRVYPYASYIAINISSPNTKGLRDLERVDNLNKLLGYLRKEHLKLQDETERRVPLVVKISPDLSSEQIKRIASCLVKHNIDGVIATNTTVSRPSMQSNSISKEKGGLSGAPLITQSLLTVNWLYQELKGEIPIIGCGGIMSSKDANDMFKAGAELVQILTGLVYQGPDLVRQIVEGVKNEEVFKSQSI
jgi:dihydroorotate dehydrogenase